ncbi:MAG TPA: S8 family serine peptidase [Catenuloplanes sp.]
MDRTSRVGFLASTLVMVLASSATPATADELSRPMGARTTQQLSPPGQEPQVRLLGTDSYQVGSDAQGWGPVRAQARFIRLRSRTFDPVVGGAEAVPPALRAAPANGAHLVQFAAAPLEAQRGELRRLGVRIGAYIPDFAYVVRMSPAVRQSVANLPYVRWVGAYQPADKVDPDATTRSSARQEYTITLVERDGVDQQRVADHVRALGGVVVELSQNRRTLQARLDAGHLTEVARRDEVLAVDRWSAPESDMDLARAAGGANHIETAGGYRGQGVRGEVMDGGLRTTHQEFRARPPLLPRGNTTSTSHGTSTYGQIFASGASPVNRGLLPAGQGVFSPNGTRDRYAHTGDLVDPAGPLRAVFQSNSWGSGLTTSYTSSSAQMDDIVFDHDLLICQSQSNDGTRMSRPQAWAKNVLSVGGFYHRNTLSRTDDAWNGGASIGPAADGRIKPDLSNYFDRTATTSSTSDTSYTGAFGGTSGATPITCGYAGLMFQMWADGVFAGAPGQNRDVFASRPHAATAKALLINSANEYPFSGLSHDLTRVHQGWGTVSVQNLYEQARVGGWRLPVLVDETDVLTVGQQRTYTVTTDGTRPLRATMVYTDPMGSPSAARARVNDLSLKVTAPDGTVFWGNNGLQAGNWSTAGGVPNTIDTVENVFVQRPAAGTWKVEVRADEVNVDGRPETAATDVDYALVTTTR